MVGYNDITKRIFTSLILILIVLLVINSPLASGILICIFIILGLYEFFSMVEKKGIPIYKYFGIIMGTMIPVSIILKFKISKTWELFFVVLAMISLIVMQFKRKENMGVIAGISTTIFGVLYVSWFLSFLIRLRFLPEGKGLLLSLLLITKLGDTGAYFIGSSFGKTPLISHISPNKTLEGACGGLLFSVMAALSTKFLLGYSYPHLLFLGLSLGTLAQLGDLSESLMKRDCNIKDSSKLLPGLGGVLDLVDSLLFTAPVFYFYISILR
ncbi:MAG: phosphatidate cytidylyltransferase [Candidatus Omnitrophica bacterium]|nr:phosphatidate cytidylyltransferase [Candidatus Omnitrophota bacterium]